MRYASLIACVLAAFGLVTSAQSGRPGPVPASTPRAVHLTLHEGTSMAAALSPDGRTLAIDLLGTLWTLPAAGGTATAISDIFLDARQPVWSPDGRRLAFQAYRTTTWQIWTVNADGSALTPVTSPGAFDDREPIWSPDGSRIAFSSDRSGSYDIWVLTLATGAVQQITFSTSNEFMPAWRSANEIAFVSDRSTAQGIYGVTLNTGTARPTDHLIAASPGALAAPAFSADGTAAFNAIVGSRSRLLVGSRNIADADEDVFPFRPQWISSGELLYTADGKIKRRPAAGGPARTIEFSADVSFTRPAFTPKRHQFERSGPQPVRGIMHPAISPDGAQIAFAALGDLWLMPVAGGSPRRLMTDAAVETEPAWSLDGTSLAYSSDRGGSMNIWIRDLQSGADRQLTRGTAAAMTPAWSPDGSRIAYVDPQGQLQIVDAKSGAVKQVHAALNEPGRPSWSPDGTAIVVSALKVYSTRFREGTNQVLRISLDGQPDRWFEPSPNKSIGMREDFGPVWSPDGTQMAAIVDGLLTAWPVSSNGTPQGPPRPLSTELAGSPTWTRDSRFILYQTDTTLKLVDVQTRRVVRETDPKLTWTQPRNASAVTVHAGRLWDGRTDAVQTDMDVVVSGGRVTSVEKHNAARHTGTVVDASRETVIPGLIEIHSHLSKSYGEALGRAFLSWGVTTVRNPATNPFESLENLEAYESGARVGPRLITTGEPFDGTRIYYPGGSALDDSGQLPLQIAHAQAAGFDFVKTYVRLPDLMQKRIIEEAHRMGMPVTSHELYPAVAYGADGVEHIRGTSRRGYSPKISALARSYRDVIDLLTASQMTLTPTIGIQGGFRLQTLRDPSWIDDPRIQRLYPPSVWERWREQTRTPASAEAIAEAARTVAPQERTILNVVRGGGRVVAGTDAPINPYGLSLLMEMENYASAGLTPLEVLRTATTVSADAMGVGADIGRIAPGSLADLVVIDGNPLTSISDLKKVKRVMKGGVVYDMDALLRR
jgi:Tol biopolymer transport system component/imidazolonepropionase-like amidohydrolase